MDTLLIIRSEIFSTIVMVILIIYDRYCSRFRHEKNTFLRFALSCLGHCIMALVTEITVNMESVSHGINDFCHILFFLTSLIFSVCYLDYVLSLILPKNKRRWGLTVAGGVLILAVVLIMVLAPIDYVQGRGTKYSWGLGPIVCYALGFSFLVAADLVMFINRNHIKKNILYSVFPLSHITLALLVAQIIVPEFLFSAEALAVTAVGLFLAIENPVEKFQSKAFIDQTSQTWNRNCYEYDVEHGIKARIGNGAIFTYVMGDINGLKAVNDTLGHIEGDKLIEMIAGILQDKFKLAFKIYRVGGDEFVAIYFDRDLDDIKEEVNAAVDTCNKIRMDRNVPVGISIGYAEGSSDSDIIDVAKKAEAMMYENKRKYYKTSGYNRRMI